MIKDNKRVHIKGLMVTVENWTQFIDADEQFTHQFTFELKRKHKAELKRILKRMFKEDESN